MATTLAELRQYVSDFWNDGSDTKSNRIFDRIVNQALRHIAQSHRWSHLVTRGKINLKAGYSTGTVDMANGGTTITLTGGTWPTDCVTSYVLLDSDTQIEFEIGTRTDAANVETKNSETWPNTSVTGGSYNLYYAKYSLPSDFQQFHHGDLEDQNLFTYMAPDRFYDYKLTTRATSGQPLFFTLYRDLVEVYPYPTTAQVWQFIYYRWPATLTNTSDEMDWPDEFLNLLYACIDTYISRHGEHTKLSFSDAYRMFVDVLRETKATDSDRYVEKFYWKLNHEGGTGRHEITPRIVNRGTFS